MTYPLATKQEREDAQVDLALRQRGKHKGNYRCMVDDNLYQCSGIYQPIVETHVLVGRFADGKIFRQINIPAGSHKQGWYWKKSLSSWGFRRSKHELWIINPVTNETVWHKPLWVRPTKKPVIGQYRNALARLIYKRDMNANDWHTIDDKTRQVYLECADIEAKS